MERRRSEIQDRLNAPGGHQRFRHLLSGFGRHGQDGDIHVRFFHFFFK